MSRTRNGFLLLMLLAALCLSVVSASGECAHGSTREKAVITPTCTETGVMGLFCTVCGEQIIDYAVPIDPLGHDYQIVTLQAPTCTQPGEAVEECSRCGQRGNTITKAATGHIPGRPDRENEVPATCTQEGGYDEVIRCSVCGNELGRTHVSTGGGSHSLGSPYIVDEPTCRHEGLAAQDCRNCGYTEAWTLEKTGHTWPDQGVNEKQVYPTCDEIGTYDYVYYCTVCGTELKREKCTWKALGHNWGEWETVREPTYDEEGLERCVCKRNSSHVQEQKLEKLDPDQMSIDVRATKEAAWLEAETARQAAEEAARLAAGNKWMEPSTTSKIEQPTRPAPAPVPVPAPQRPAAPAAPVGNPSQPVSVNYQIVRIQDADAFADDLISELSKENKTPAIDADTLKAVLEGVKDPAEKPGVENTLEALGKDYAVYHSNGQKAPSDPDLSAYHFLCGFEQFKLESGQRADQNGNPQPFEISVAFQALFNLKAEEINNTMMMVYDPESGKTALIRLSSADWVAGNPPQLKVTLPFAGLFTFIQK